MKGIDLKCNLLNDCSRIHLGASHLLLAVGK